MKVAITNFRGIASANLNLSGVCLLAGTNEAGKTSTSQALAAALTGDPIPVQGVKKSQAGMLVRSGYAAGNVTLEGDDGKTVIQWPTAKVRGEGTAPHASVYAAGLSCIAAMDEKERFKALTEYLNSHPERADLDEHLKGMELGEDILTKLWDMIQLVGWESAHSQIKEKGARLKGQWQQITGEQYGSKKGDTWLPSGYEAGLEMQSEEMLQAGIVDARDTLEAAIAADAVGDARRQELQALAMQKEKRLDVLKNTEALTVDPAMGQQILEANEFVASLSAKRDELNEVLKGLPSHLERKHMTCPNCNVSLNLISGGLRMASVLSEDEIVSRRTAIEEQNNKIAAVNDSIAQHMQHIAQIKSRIRDEEGSYALKVAEARRLYEEAEEAERVLSKPAPEGGVANIDECRNNLSAAERRLVAFRAKVSSDSLHDNITKNQQLVEAVGPEGIRGVVMMRAIRRFNETMLPFTKQAGWRTVTMEAGLTLAYGGTPYMLLSESAKFRVRVVLQIAMSLIDGSQALIVDAADILDKGGRNGLLKALRMTKLPCLVTMTMDSRDSVPNLAKAGMGSSYWINESAEAEAI